MSNIYKGEMQDYEGNTVYPHTEADVVFCTDGTTAQSKLNKYENALGAVTGKTDTLTVSNSNILATSKAVNTLNTNLNKVRTYVGSDGKLHFVNASGADTVLPFSNLENIKETSISEVCGGYNEQMAYTATQDCLVLCAWMNRDSGATKNFGITTTGTVKVLHSKDAVYYMWSKLSTRLLYMKAGSTVKFGNNDGSNASSSCSYYVVLNI